CHTVELIVKHGSQGVSRAVDWVRKLVKKQRTYNSVQSAFEKAVPGISLPPSDVKTRSWSTTAIMDVERTCLRRREVRAAGNHGHEFCTRGDTPRPRSP